MKNRWAKKANIRPRLDRHPQFPMPRYLGWIPPSPGPGETIQAHISGLYDKSVLHHGKISNSQTITKLSQMKNCSPSLGILVWPLPTRTSFTCLFNVHKLLQTLKQCVKVFNERLVGVYEVWKMFLSGLVIIIYQGSHRHEKQRESHGKICCHAKSWKIRLISKV